MPDKLLTLYARPEMRGTRLVMGLSGWMDGGDVSTDAIAHLIDALDAEPLADIDPDPFYIYNFPGSMEVSALFRPHTRIEDGIITHLDTPENRFYHCQANNLIFFRGKEPNLCWPEYAECIFDIVDVFDVREIYFVGSVAGTIPHTKAPRFRASVSIEALKLRMVRQSIELTSYEGPASFITYLMTRACDRHVPMASLVAEIPAYVQGKNLKCIEAAVHKVAELLGIDIQLTELHALSAAFEQRLGEIVRSRPDLSDLIKKMEQNYDKERENRSPDEIRDWFEGQGWTF